MALKKLKYASNGVPTEYHRVALITIDVNNRTTFLVHSYLSAEGRQIEKDYAAGKYNDVEFGLMQFPYVDANYITIAYDGYFTISKAYEYLKSLPEFEGAEDI